MGGTLGLGFDEIEIGVKRHQYFKGIPEHLRQLGIEVFVFRGKMLSTIPDRADLLAKYLMTLPSKRVNLVAHSMGGLDARYAIAKLGCSPKVTSFGGLVRELRRKPLYE